MAYLRAFGSYLPPERVGSDTLAKRTGKNEASIEKASGILERRYAAELFQRANEWLANIVE